MLTNPLAEKYARAIFELATEEGLVDTIGRDLRMVSDTIGEQKDLSVFFRHPLVQRTAKKEVVEKIFGKEIHALAARFLQYLIDKRRETILDEIADVYIKLTYEVKNITEAEVVSAMPLTAEQEKKLAEALARRTGKTILLKKRIDKSLLGGMGVRIGDQLLDGSVKRQLSELKSALLRAELGKSGVTDER